MILFAALALLALVTLWEAEGKLIPAEVCVIVNNGTWSESRPTVVPRFWLTELNV
jgi:hypothetical protein